MSTQFHALRLGDKINLIVTNMSASSGTDLNSVEWVTCDCLQVGETRTGNVILIRNNPRGVNIDWFEPTEDNKGDVCIGSVFVQHAHITKEG